MQTSQKTTPAILFLLIATTALVLSCTHARVFASQLPGGGVTLPTLLPDPGQDVFVPIQTVDLHRATDIVWASILGTEEKDPVLANLFDSTPILVSGVMDIEGKEYLYLGVERAYHDRHGSKHIYQTLRKRFPGTPIYVEPSDGIELQEETWSREDAAPVQTTGESLTFSASPNKPIEDNKTVKDTIEVQEQVTVGTAHVTLDISHPTKSDLTIDLVAPSGATVTVYDGNSGGVTEKDNLIETRQTNALRGQKAQGTWTLNVTDHEEEDEGVLQSWKLTLAPMSSGEETEDNTLFRDTFTDGLAKWTADSLLSDSPGWEARALDETGDIVARTQDCSLLCNLTTAEPLNLKDHETVQLTFDRWIDKEVGNGEGLALHVGNNGIYRTVGQWRRGDSAWRTETVTLRNLSGNVTIRFTAIPSSVFNASPKTIAIDNVTITETPQETTEGGLTPRITAQPTEAEPNQPITLSVTVQNTGTTTEQGTVRLYRHLSKTDTPTQGGTRLPQTADTGAIAPNGQATKTIQTTVPTPDIYHYYACIEDICSATPATVTVREQEPTETTDTFSLSKTNASQNNVDAQSTFSLTTTVTNTGDTTANPATVSFYLHEHATNTPNIGGTKIAQSARAKELSPNESETLSVTTVAQNVTATTVVRYYACIEDVCSAPATVRIREGNTPGATDEPDTPDEPDTTDMTDTTDTPEPTTNTNNAITKLTASPWEPESGTPIIVRFTVQNTGTKTKDITVRVYQHTSRITRPTNGIPIGEMTVESIAPKTSVTEHVMVTVPTVTRETPVYYHACVGDRCMGPAEVTVYMRGSGVGCNMDNVRKTPMGGDFMHVKFIGDSKVKNSCATITLGGLEATDGTRGFVVSGHALDFPDSTTFFTNTDVFVGHGSHWYSADFIDIRNFLGKAFKTSSRRTEGDKTIIVADAAFIAYPYPNTSGCSLTWRNQGGEVFCLDTGLDGHVIERVTPITIRGKDGEIYTVIGSRQPTKGLEVNISGSSSGIGKEGEVGNRMLTGAGRQGSGLYKYSYVTTKTDTIPGDSGSPTFTVPDADGNVYIVGVHSGRIVVKDDFVTFFSSWGDTVKALELHSDI